MRFAGIIEPGVASGIVTRAQYVQGSYIVVKDIAERDAIALGVRVIGTPVYISDLQKTQRWNGTTWVDESKGTVSGYYYNDNFYVDASHTELMEAIENQLYIDKANDLSYFYNGSRYVSLSADLTEVDERLLALEIGKQNKITQENKLSKDLVDGLDVYSLITETGSKIELVLNNTNYKLKSVLKDKNDNVIYTSNEIDLPIEEIVKDGRYDDELKAIILELVSGAEIIVPIGDLVSGLQEKIDEEHKLPAELVDGTENGSFNTVFVSSLTWVSENNIEYKSEQTATDLETLKSHIRTLWGAQVNLDARLFVYEAGVSVNIAKLAEIKQVNDLYYLDIKDIDNLYVIYLFIESNRLYRIRNIQIPVGEGTNFLQEVSASIELGEVAGTAYEGSKGKQLAQDINTLQGYFSGDKAVKAIGDADGNDIRSTYATKSELNAKQDVLTAGTNITIDENNVISADAPSIVIDDELSPTSENAVQNKVILSKFNEQENEFTTELAKKQNIINNDNKLSANYVSGLSNVATSGNYDDLINKPVIPEGVIVDSEMSTTSTNPVQNKVITGAINNKQDKIDSSHKLSADYISGLSNVAKTGSYNDLSNKPTYARVATTGDYNDLTNKYVLPKATTITLGGLVVGDHLKVDENGKVDVDVEEITGGFITKTEADSYYVSSGVTVADLPVKNSITAAALKQALNLDNVVNVGTTSQAIANDNRNITSGGVYYVYNLLTNSISSLSTSKQDKLTAGVGISITENGVISATSGVSFRVVQSLPVTGDSNVIYLVHVEQEQPSDIYAEYLWIENSWEKIGTTQTSIDGYVPVTRTIAGIDLTTNIPASTLKAALQLTKADVGLGNVANVSTDSQITQGSNNNISSGAVYNALKDKQDKLPTTARAGQILTSTNVLGQVVWEDKPNVEPTTTELEKENYSDADSDYLETITNPKTGDFAIVKAPIANNKWEYTGYVYSVDTWVAMDGNYNAENVYFSGDFVYTADIGVKTVPASGSGTIEATGKNLNQVLSSIFAEEKKGTMTQPSTSITLTGAGTYEVGTTVIPQYSTSFNKGSYQYGPSDTEVVIDSRTVTDTDSHSSTDASGSFDSFVVADNTNYRVSVSITHSNGVWAKTNLGNQPETGDLAQRIVTNTVSANSSRITGYRKTFWYVGTDETSGTTSALIRAYPNSYNGVKTTLSLTIAAGTKRVTIAVPGNHTLTSVIDVDGMGLDVKDNFTKTTVAVEGANGYTATNYSVFEFINTNGLSATTYNVTMS